MFLFVGIIYFCPIVLFTLVSTTAENYKSILDDILLNEGLNTFEIVKKYGYPLEVHRLVTEDGYVIEVHRIPYGHNNLNEVNRPAVLVAPGIDITSEDFVSTGNSSLTFFLSEAGYDVWLYNTRGTGWSRRHISRNPDYKEFWTFSWHEVGIYDYSACIDHIRNVTKQEQIYFIGFSQGGTSFSVLMSEKPEYNKRIRLALLMGSSIYTAHNKHSMILYAAKHYDMLKTLIEPLGLYEIRIDNFRVQFCTYFMFFCKYFIYMVGGYDTEQVDERFIPVFLSNPSRGMAMKVLEHYAQIYTTKKFQKMDYGQSENLVKYGSVDPPEYPLSKITVPIALFCGKNDPLAACEDIADLANDLSNVILNYIVPFEMWTHIDFIHGKDAPELVYKIFLELMRKY